MSTLLNVKLRMGTDITINNAKVYVEVEDPVSILKQKICTLDKDLNVDDIELVYMGVVMEDHEALGIYGVLHGITVHAFKKVKYDTHIAPKELTEVELLKLGVAFRSLSLNYNYKNALSKLSRPEIILNIIMTTPALSHDPVAITLLQHSELLVRLGDLEIIKRIAENHPALVEATHHIAAAVHEETLQMQNNRGDRHYLPPSLLSNLTDISDDEIEDMEDSSPESSSQSVSRSESFAITAAQLAAAIARATPQDFQLPQNLPGTSSSTSTANTSTASTSTGITRDMLRSVIGDLQNQPASNSPNLQTQVQKMRDMGLSNDAINIEALRVSNGDLAAAIELVLSGFMNED
ncbi:ubiquitin-like protein 7 [Adelges cooleyi]|uniref:ubiquitin-like protein 7 n=1 Tax=Adelges cooleyi TaxID=133065 RepID=UPI0021801008|nr:ubiquitin-like protein 7 [Adelges cooleyi]